MTSRPPYRLVPVLLVALVLVAAVPGLAAPAPERQTAASALQFLHELWADVTGPIASLLATGSSEDSGVAPASPPSAPAGAEDDPQAQPQLGHDDDPNG